MGVSRQRVQQLVAPPKKTRDFVVEQASGNCQYCGLHVGKSGHVHHDGPSAVDNFDDVAHLQLLCINCHRTAHVPLQKIREAVGRTWPSPMQKIGPRLEDIGEENTIVTLPEFAAATGLNPETLRRWVRGGLIPGRKFGRVWCLDIAELKRVYANEK